MVRWDCKMNFGRSPRSLYSLWYLSMIYHTYGFLKGALQMKDGRSSYGQDDNYNPCMGGLVI